MAGVAAYASPAAAQQARGFSTNRFEPAARGSEWFVLDTLDMRGSGRFAFGVTGDWAHDPLVIYNADGSTRNEIVSDQIAVHVGAGVNLFDRLRLNVNMPAYVYATGDTGTVRNVTLKAPTSAQSIGDVRAGADIRIGGEYRGGFQLAGGVDVWIPTATEGSYTSDGSGRFQPHFIGAGEIGPFVYSARVGVMYRSRDEKIVGGQLGTELDFGGAVGLRLADGRLVIGPEFYGSTVVVKSGVFDKRSTPVEGIFGAHVKVGAGFRIGAGGGAGLTRGFGSPGYRVLLGIDWMSEIEERKDRDHDGIYDDEDACPDVAGVHADDPKKNGCPVEPEKVVEEPPPPPPSDRDKDGIIDSKDACPDDAGPASEDPKKNGCPDRDKDGIIDKDDACPDAAGVASADPKKNGCPEDPDRDHDGIPNAEDACPDEPGKQDKDPKRNGCPQAFIKDGQIKILDQVKFATNSTAIVPGKDSESILEAVKKVLTDHPEIKKVRIEGHTDNRGTAAANQKLSEGRARSVVTWLTKHGIEESRLSSAGFGQTRPMAENTSEDGRRLNRRVEFHIESEEKAK
jgi:outer membrane protein OmpA-like peptidoglycan-associated protein